MYLGFVVPRVFKYSNKTPNQMQHSVVKFIALLHRRCSTCFGHHYAHHQELSQTAVAASGFRINVEVDVFPATNKPTTAGNTSTSAFIRKPEAATAV
jgi:ATP-dependent Zn protease